MTKQQASPLKHLTTESYNPVSANIDTLSSLGIVHLMNDEDARVARAVRNESNSIARAIDIIADRLRIGGRLIYLGAGTSGRLGGLDASECPATFGTPLMNFWNNGVRAIAVGFGYSFFWTATGAIYLLLRRDVDQKELDEVYFAEEADDASSSTSSSDEDGGEAKSS